MKDRTGPGTLNVVGGPTSPVSPGLGLRRPLAPELDNGKGYFDRRETLSSFGPRCHRGWKERGTLGGGG